MAAEDMAQRSYQWIVTGEPGCKRHLAEVKHGHDAETLCGRFLMDVMPLLGSRQDWPWAICKGCEKRGAIDAPADKQTISLGPGGDDS